VGRHADSFVADPADAGRGDEQSIASQLAPVVDFEGSSPRDDPTPSRRPLTASGREVNAVRPAVGFATVDVASTGCLVTGGA
jgi:hypothetical protein